MFPREQWRGTFAKFAFDCAMGVGREGWRERRGGLARPREEFGPILVAVLPNFHVNHCTSIYACA